jgi:GNAT superfamily N-acetyltransferase
VGVRPARADEAGLLSELALASKGHWGYDARFLEACRAELTLTPQDVTAQRAVVVERDGRVLGFHTLAGQPPVLELAMMFVHPEHVGRGVGRELWVHAVDAADRLGAERVTIDADPHAEAFYLAMGAVRVGEVASGSIPGRSLPRLEYRLPLATLAEAVRRRDPDAVDALLTDTHRLDQRGPGFVALLCELLVADWHHRHEDVASTLQAFADPAAVPALRAAAELDFPYREYDEDIRALSRKCMWALSDTRTPEAVAALESLTRSSNARVRELATHHLAKVHNGQPPSRMGERFRSG